MMLPPSGTWDSGVRTLGPVEVCRGGTIDSGPSCNQWPLSIMSMPVPDSHYAELRMKAAELYQVDSAAVVLKDINVVYSTEINGVIRGWRAKALAGKIPVSETLPVVSPCRKDDDPLDTAHRKTTR